MIEYKNVIGVLVFNAKNELALQLRAAKDDSFPLHWDFSAGGGIDGGEDSEESAKRELDEELGINAEVELIANEHLTYQAWTPETTREVDLALYKAQHEGPFTPDPKEVEEVRFFSIDKIREMVESGEKFHPEFSIVWSKGLIAQ